MASPAIGAVSAAIVYWIILYVVHRSSAPGRRAMLLQPLFVAVTVAVAAGFIVIKGPDALKIKPTGVGVAASIGIGAAVGLLVMVLRVLRNTRVGRRMGGGLVSSINFLSLQLSRKSDGDAPAAASEPTLPAAKLEAAIDIARAGTPVVVVEAGTAHARAALRGEVPDVCTLVERASS